MSNNISSASYERAKKINALAGERIKRRKTVHCAWGFGLLALLIAANVYVGWVAGPEALTVMNYMLLIPAYLLSSIWHQELGRIKHDEAWAFQGPDGVEITELLLKTFSARRDRLFGGPSEYAPAEMHDPLDGSQTPMK